MKHVRVQIRRESPLSDLVTQLLDRYFAELAARLPDGFDPGEIGAERRQYQAPSGVFLVAFVDAQPAGCGALRRFNDGTAELRRLWVDPSMRRHGVGRTLVDELETVGREVGYQRLCLDTSAHLPEAIALYRSAGFEDIADYNGNPDAAYWFSKRLD